MSERVETGPDRRVEDPTWAPVLAGLHTRALDCLQTSFALLADHAHGTGSHLALGAPYGFRTRASGDLVGVEATPDDRAAEATDLLGLHVDARWIRLDGPRVRRLARSGTPLYLTADAYDLPWCPYAGHEHMRHSFLCDVSDAGATIIDAYDNDTAWGPARPGVWHLTPDEFDAALAGGAHILAVDAGPLPRIDVPATLAENAERSRRAEPRIDRFLATARSQVVSVAGLRRFVLDVWLLGRERLLHAEWLTSVRPAARPDLASQSERWQQLASRSYLALRRAAQGRPADPGIVDGLAELIGANAETLTALADAERNPPATGAEPATGPEPVRDVVLHALRESLPVDAAGISASATLRDLPGFNSFRLVDVIDRVERDLGVRLPDNAIAAADLRDVDSLCAMFATAERGRS